MKSAILQMIQIISLVLAASYQADAQMGRPGRPPGPMQPPRAEDLLDREWTEVVDLGSYGLLMGNRQLIDLTRDVIGRARLQEISSIVILASSERGLGELNAYVNGVPILKRAENLSMKRRAIQLDMYHSIRDIRSFQIETTGRVLIHSLTVSSSRFRLPPLPDYTGNQTGGMR